MSKPSVRRCLIFYALLLYATTSTWGQDQNLYLQSLNSKIPTTPEAATLMKYIDFPVSLFTGKANVDIPICEVKGKSLSVPIRFSYTASSGIKINDLASNVGLGFLLMCGGEITREVRGKPDEGCCGGTGIITNTMHPISSYFNDPNQLSNAAKGLIDLEPDMFYFSCAGATGKFMYDESSSSFVCTQLEPYKISFDQPNSIFQITGPDGNTYLFDKKVTTTTVPSCNTANTITNPPSITTSWKLTKIYNADRTDSISIEYDINTYSYYSEGSSTKYQLQMNGSATASRPNLECFNLNTINGWDKILSISSSTDTVTFQYGTTERSDLGYQQKPISYIIFTNGEPTAKKIFKMDYDYYARNYELGDYHAIQNAGYNYYSLRLLGITNYGNSESNPNPLKWLFSYNTTLLPTRLSYLQDFWGYYNSNTVSSTLVPQDILTNGNGYITYVDGADRFPDTSYTGAGILQQIQFPTGGTTTFEYEPNTTSIPTNMAKPRADISIGQVILQGDQPPAAPYGNQSKTFTVNVPNNPEAGMANGVIATVSIAPTTPPSQPNNPYIPGYPYFSLSNSEGTFSRNFWINPTETVFLPNGHYTMTVNINGYHGNSSTLPPNDGGASTLGVDYDIAYQIPDTTTHPNYILGGLRVKSITTQDQYANITTKRQFQYHDPVTDSSYGVYTGLSILTSDDYLVKDLPPSGGGSNGDICETYRFLARHGNSMMPLGNSLGAVVVYPKVIEYTVDGNKSYKTEHIYNFSPPQYVDQFPFAPPFTHESGDGKLLSSTAFKTVNNTNYWPAKKTLNQYNFTPTTLASNGSAYFKKLIPAMRVAFAGYTDNMTCLVDPAVTNFYYNEINRADLTSDSTVTYDLNNQYNGITEWHDYVYGDYNQQPIVVRSGNSDGTVSKQENYYPVDYPGTPTVLTPGSFQFNLSLSNRVNQLLATKSYKGSQLVSQQQFYGHFNTNDPRMLIDSMQDALMGNPLQTEVKVLSYDDAANPVKIEMRGGKYRQYIWKNDLPIGTCVSGNKDDYFYFTSFEYPEDNGGTNFGHIFSGKLAFGLGVNTPFIVHTPALYNTDVYFWAANGSIPVNVNGAAPTPTGKTRNYNGNWVQYRYRVQDGATSVRIGVTQFQPVFPIDDVVIVPHGSQFKGVVYDSSNGVTATVNDQIETNFYEYDPFGRLTIIRDEKGNILKSTSYQYQAAQ